MNAAELLAHSGDLKNEWQKAEHRTQIALLFIQQCDQFSTSWKEKIKATNKNKEKQTKNTTNANIANNESKTKDTDATDDDTIRMVHRALANDILRKFVVRRHNKGQQGKVQHGHDSLSDIGSPLTTWLHMLESKAKLVEMQAERVRLNDTAIHVSKCSKKFDLAVSKFQQAIHAYQVLPVNARSQRGVCRCQMGICDTRRQVLDPTSLTDVDDLLADYDVVIALANEIGDQALEATQHKNKGIVLKSRAKACEGTERHNTLQRALTCYLSASEVQGRLGVHQERVKSLRGIAGVHQMLGEYRPALEACEESIALARACGYRAGVTRAQRVQAEIVISMVENNEDADESISDRNEDRNNLMQAKRITDNLMLTVTAGNKIKAGDVARASFVVARVRMAIYLFYSEDNEGNVSTRNDSDADLAEGVTLDLVAKLLKEAKQLFVDAGDQTMSTQVDKYCRKHNVVVD